MAAAAPGLTLGVVGSRHFTDYELLKSLIDQIRHKFRVARLVSGGCDGVDTLAARYAREHSLPMVEHLAQWEIGKRAGPLRNDLIVADADVLLALVASNSRGTLDTIRKAKVKPIPVFEINI